MGSGYTEIPELQLEQGFILSFSTNKITDPFLSPVSSKISPCPPLTCQHFANCNQVLPSRPRFPGPWLPGQLWVTPATGSWADTGAVCWWFLQPGDGAWEPGGLQPASAAAVCRATRHGYSSTARHAEHLCITSSQSYRYPSRMTLSRFVIVHPRPVWWHLCILGNFHCWQPLRSGICTARQLVGESSQDSALCSTAERSNGSFDLTKSRPRCRSHAFTYIPIFSPV